MDSFESILFMIQTVLYCARDTQGIPNCSNIYLCPDYWNDAELIGYPYDMKPMEVLRFDLVVRNYLLCPGRRGRL